MWRQYHRGTYFLYLSFYCITLSLLPVWQLLNLVEASRSLDLYKLNYLRTSLCSTLIRLLIDRLIHFIFSLLLYCLLVGYLSEGSYHQYYCFIVYLTISYTNIRYLYFVPEKLYETPIGQSITHKCFWKQSLTLFTIQFTAVAASGFRFGGRNIEQNFIHEFH